VSESALAKNAILVEASTDWPFVSGADSPAFKMLVSDRNSLTVLDVDEKTFWVDLFCTPVIVITIACDGGVNNKIDSTVMEQAIRMLE
jgi:hypothetical protein